MQGYVLLVGLGKSPPKGGGTFPYLTPQNELRITFYRSVANSDGPCVAAHGGD